MLGLESIAYMVATGIVGFLVAVYLIDRDERRQEMERARRDAECARLFGRAPKS